MCRDRKKKEFRRTFSEKEGKGLPKEVTLIVTRCSCGNGKYIQVTAQELGYKGSFSSPEELLGDNYLSSMFGTGFKSWILTIRYDLVPSALERDDFVTVGMKMIQEVKAR